MKTGTVTGLAEELVPPLVHWLGKFSEGKLKLTFEDALVAGLQIDLCLEIATSPDIARSRCAPAIIARKPHSRSQMGADSAGIALTTHAVIARLFQLGKVALQRTP